MHSINCFNKIRLSLWFLLKFFNVEKKNYNFVLSLFKGLDFDWYFSINGNKESYCKKKATKTLQGKIGWYYALKFVGNLFNHQL